MKREEVLTLHDLLCFLDLSAPDVAGKFTELLEITVRWPVDERNASQLCDERRNIIVVDIAAALMVLHRICICVIAVFVRVSMLTSGGFSK